MGLVAWGNSKIKNLGCYDMGLVKISVFFFALMLAKLYSPLLALDWYWYAAVFLLAGIIPTYKVFKGK